MSEPETTPPTFAALARLLLPWVGVALAIVFAWKVGNRLIDLIVNTL